MINLQMLSCCKCFQNTLSAQTFAPKPCRSSFLHFLYDSVLLDSLTVLRESRGPKAQTREHKPQSKIKLNVSLMPYAIYALNSLPLPVISLGHPRSTPYLTVTCPCSGLVAGLGQCFLVQFISILIPSIIHNP